MAKRWETIRVFISSTFRDMHAERDYLVEVVFPRLRERLDSYQYHLENIDVRWDIDEEQAADSKKICRQHPPTGHSQEKR